MVSFGDVITIPMVEDGQQPLDQFPNGVIRVLMMLAGTLKRFTESGTLGSYPGKSSTMYLAKSNVLALMPCTTHLANW